MFLGRDLIHPRPSYGERTGREIDLRVRALAREHCSRPSICSNPNVKRWMSCGGPDREKPCSRIGSMICWLILRIGAQPGATAGLDLSLFKRPSSSAFARLPAGFHFWSQWLCCWPVFRSRWPGSSSSALRTSISSVLVCKALVVLSLSLAVVDPWRQRWMKAYEPTPKGEIPALRGGICAVSTLTLLVL